MTRKLIAAAAVAALAGAIASGVSGGVRANPQQMYYGVTSRGGQVTFFVQGNAIVPAGIDSYLLYRIGHSDWLEFHPRSGQLVFRGGKIAYHHFQKLGGGSVETWLTARLAQNGDRMAGTFRERDNIYGHWVDTGTLRFAATRWAAENGVAWIGKTAAGEPLPLLVSFKQVPGHTIVNGKRTVDQAFEVSAPAIATTLACRDAAGVAASVPVTLPPLKGSLYGRVDYPSFATGLKSLGAATATATTPQEITLDASLVVTKLSWRSGLVATGTLKVAARPAGGSCDATNTGFTAHPR
jgi:hypothetical protein